MSILNEQQRRRTARSHRKMTDRKQNKVRQKLERAMRDNGSLGRLVAVQAALRKKDVAEAIHAAVREHEALRGKITTYEALRAIVQVVLSELGLDLAGVMLKFSCGPGCGGCDHPHDQEHPCGYPGCICKKWSPGRLLGIMASPHPDAIREAAKAAGVEAEIDRPV